VIERSRDEHAWPSAAAAGFLLVVVAVALAGDAPAFRYARPVVPAAAGPNRLVVDVPLLAGARPLRFDAARRDAGGLDDLRLVAGDGAEVPYLVVPPPDPARQWRDGGVQAIFPTKEASGFEADLGEVVRVDRMRVTGLPTPLLKRARLEGSGDRERWVVLAPEVTVFDLPDEGLRRTEIAFEPTEVRHLRLTWDDRASARVPLPAAVSAELAGVAMPAPVLAPLAFERRQSEPGTSRFRIRLPGPGLPIRALELDCGGGPLLRPARVTEPELAGDAVMPRELGRGTLRRVARDDAVAADLRIAIAPPRELELELVVDDRDNPPLDLRGVRAELPPMPWLYFVSAEGATLTAKFGAPDLPGPRYDLEAARGTVDAETVATATWGERTSLPEPPAAPRDGHADLATAGAPIERDAFRWVRDIPAGPAGLTAVRLDAAVLAHSAGLADVRVIDADGRQVPYVVEHVGAPLAIPLPVPASEPATTGQAARRGTTYRIELPYEMLPQARLVLETTGRIFEREVTVRSPRPPDPRTGEAWQRLGSATWRHVDAERPAPSLTIELPPLESTTVLVDVDDGDNSPLPVTSARLLLPASRLRFVREDGAHLELAYGAPGLAAPRYDLRLLAPRILGASAFEVTPSDERAGAASTADARRDVVGQRVFWGVLAGAVVVLLVVLARLVRVDERSDAA
jgi:hypothetical protein